jgi:hypothetical protein
MFRKNVLLPFMVTEAGSCGSQNIHLTHHTVQKSKRRRAIDKKPLWRYEKLYNRGWPAKTSFGSCILEGNLSNRYALI